MRIVSSIRPDTHIVLSDFQEISNACRIPKSNNLSPHSSMPASSVTLSERAESAGYEACINTQHSPLSKRLKPIIIAFLFPHVTPIWKINCPAITALLDRPECEIAAFCFPMWVAFPTLNRMRLYSVSG
jgi:hypothetical protein